MDQKEFRARLQAYDLLAWEERITPLLAPAVLMKTVEVDEDTPVGATRIGGPADLPGTTPWPVRNGVPMAFLCQLNLEEIARFEGMDALPSHGLLSFFYDVKGMPWGFDPKHAGGARVIWSPNVRTVSRCEMADAMPKEGRFQPCRVELKGTVTLPYDPPGFDFTDKQGDDFGDLASSLVEEPIHQVLGHAEPIQGSMEHECHEMMTKLRALPPGATVADWRLLCQIDTDDNAGMTWGDGGRLYFWIRKQDLAARRFDAAWMILQCF